MCTTAITRLHHLQGGLNLEMRELVCKNVVFCSHIGFSGVLGIKSLDKQVLLSLAIWLLNSVSNFQSLPDTYENGDYFGVDYQVSAVSIPIPLVPQ